MEPLIPTFPIRRPNCLTFKSYTLTPSFLLPFFLSILFAPFSALSTSWGILACRIKPSGYTANEQKDLVLVSTLLMKLFSNLNPDRCNHSTVKSLKLQAFSVIAARELAVIVSNSSFHPLFYFPLKFTYANSWYLQLISYGYIRFLIIHEKKKRSKTERTRNTVKNIWIKWTSSIHI